MHNKTRISCVYTLLHLLVDFATVYLVCRVLLGPGVGIVHRAEVIIVYNLVAFAGQLPMGIIADGINKNRMFALLGCGLAMAAYPIAYISPWTACVLASLGNGAFHIGAGSEILKISMPKISLAGVFVSSGALGVWLAYNVRGSIFETLLPCVMLISCIGLLFLAEDAEKSEQSKPEPYFLPGIAVLFASSCFLLTVVIRSFAGMIMNFSWKAQPLWSFLSVMAVVGGKAFGGILADRLGYVKTSVISLLASLIAFMFSFDTPVCGIIAMLCFNMTMPLTLTALAQMCGKKYGFAFGLTTFALAIGFIPMVFGAANFFSPGTVAASVIISLLLLIAGFKSLRI